MTMDFFLGQLRLALVAALAYAGGRGWLTPTDSGFAVALITSLGPIIGPWIWSVYVNINGKIVPQHTVVIDPINTAANADKPSATVQTMGGTVTGKVLSLMAVLMLAGMLWPSGAQAQTRKPVINLPIDPLHLNTTASATLDNIAATLAKPFQDIANFIGEDATGAVDLATAVPTLQDGHGQQCWMAMEQFGEVIKAHPIPITFHVITDYETLRLLGMATNNLCSNVHCTQVFSDATAMAQAASPMPLAIPSLHDLCTKVPQIAVVAPVTVSAPPTVPAAAPAAK